MTTVLYRERPIECYLYNNVVNTVYDNVVILYRERAIAIDPLYI